MLPVLTLPTWQLGCLSCLQMLCLKVGKQVTERNLDLHPFKPDPKAAQAKSRRADMPEEFTTQESYQRFILLLQQLKDEVKQQDGVQYSPSLHQLIDWPILIDMPKLQPLITPLLSEEVEWLKYAVEKVRQWPECSIFRSGHHEKRVSCKVCLTTTHQQTMSSGTRGKTTACAERPYAMACDDYGPAAHHVAQLHTMGKSLCMEYAIIQISTYCL